MDYTVRDSSVLPDTRSMKEFRQKDDSIRVGIVREEVETPQGTRYIVEVLTGGKQVPVSCTVMTRFGGAHNYEEFKPRSWLSGFPSGALLPASAGKYAARSGDVVLVAYLDGKSREGVILGGITHGARKEKLAKGEIGYISEFNGLETQVREDGSYKVTFKGKPINAALLKIPPTGINVPSPVYNPLITGSYFGFDANGSYVVSDGSDQFIKIFKSSLTRATIIKSGGNMLELGGNLIKSVTSMKTDEIVLEASLNASLKANNEVTLQGLQFSAKALKFAIGNDQFELMDGLIQLVDAIGEVTVTSPVGTCTPIMASPQWAAKVLPLKIKMMLVKGSLKDAKSAEFSGEDDPAIGDDVGGGSIV